MYSPFSSVTRANSPIVRVAEQKKVRQHDLRDHEELFLRLHFVVDVAQLAPHGLVVAHVLRFEDDGAGVSALLTARQKRV